MGKGVRSQGSAKGTVLSEEERSRASDRDRSLDDGVLDDGNLLSEQLFSDIPVGIREFMKTEKMLKERHSKQEVLES